MAINKHTKTWNKNKSIMCASHCVVWRMCKMASRHDAATFITSSKGSDYLQRD